MNPNLVLLYGKANPHHDARIDKHYDGYATLQLATAGAVELFYGQERFVMDCAEDTCWFWTAFPGPRIRFHATSGYREWEHRFVSFTGPLVEHWKHTGLWLEVPQRMSQVSHHAAAFDELLFHVRRGSGSWAMRRAINLLEGILLELAEARSCGGSEAWLIRTQHFLEECDDFTPDYADLARELGMSLSTLRRKFRAATGASLHEVLLQRRLNNAKRLLAETDLPLKAVADELGYRDVYFFAKQFKQLASVTPAAFRQGRQT